MIARSLLLTEYVYCEQILLQSLYQAFDLIARRRKVFKIETIGGTDIRLLDSSQL